MRPKIVVIILLAGLAGVIGILLARRQASPSAAPAPTAIAKAKPGAPQTAPTITNVPPPAAPAAAALIATNALTDEQRQAAIDAETERLQQLGMNDDATSLSNILADLTNPEKEIRKAALEAAEQFGSSNAIPVLNALAARNEYPEERAALLEAAHFISLPSIFEVDPSVTPAEREARRQARMQKHAADQNPPAAPNK